MLDGNFRDLDQIAGPRSRVDAVQGAFTEPLSVEGTETTVTDVVNVGLDDPMLRILGSPRVRATVRIQEVEGERALDGLPIEVRPEGAVRPAAARVVLAGPASLLRTLTPADVHAWVDLSAARPGAEAPVTVDLSPGHAGLHVKEVAPASVAVRAPRPPRRTR